MGGLVWSRVSRDVDHSAWWELAALDMLSEEHQRRLWRTLDHVVATCADLGLEVATVKGITAQARWYARPGERPCSDLDLLVSPADFGRAREIIETLHPGHVLAPDANRLVRNGLLQSIDLVVEGVPVDLHFDVLKLGIPARQNRRIWERTVPFALPNGRQVRVLDPDTALIHLLVHLNKDRFRWLLGYADVARLLAHEQPDWAFIERFSRDEGLDVAVGRTLQVVVEALDLAPTPTAVPRDWRTAVWDLLWRPGVRLQGDLGTVRFRHRQDALPVLAPGRRREALWLWLRRRLFPPRAFLDEWYPGTSGPYLWRVVRGRAENVWNRQRAWLSRMVGESRS